ncbi:MAG: IS110 family transposase [Chlamydiales bacterium]|nr:IS110 family transposase [Chlamydiales bacterium]MCP5506468.1 IS110 family transposase [Chlamydiales bacterium]
MKHYIGLDISKKETAVCMIDEQGKVLHEKMVITDPDTIYDTIKGFGNYEIDTVGLESGSWSYWMEEELISRGLPALTCDARKIATFLSLKINKTDKNDARGIAECLRVGCISTIAPKSKRHLGLSVLLKSRKQLVMGKVDLQMAIRGLIKPFGKMMNPHQGKAFIESVLKNIKELPETAREGIEAMIECFKKLTEEIKRLDKQITKLAGEIPETKRLMSIPGIGMVTALTYYTEIGNPKRFKKSKDVGAYIGLTPRQYSSGETERLGRISKKGPPMIRSLLVEAGIVILTRSSKWSKLKAWGHKIEKKHGRKKAAVALGRKLAVIMHQLLVKEDEQFKYKTLDLVA